MSPNTKSVLLYFLLFLVIFLILSGVLGSWIVGSPLLYGANLYIYANMGKMVLLFAVFFPFVIRDKMKKLPEFTWHPGNLIYGIISATFVLLFFIVASNLITRLNQPSLYTLLPKPGVVSPVFYPTLTVHLLLPAIPILLLIAVFGVSYILKFIRIFKKELGISVIFAIILYFGIFQAWKLWPFFASGVLTAVSFLFSLTFPTRVIPPYTLVVDSFGVQIAQACSGIDSLFMFSGLYLFIGLIDWKKIERNKWVLMYIPTALGLYIVNILRVYLIILVGVLWSPQLALKLFHTYAGMVLFIIYFILFLKFLYPKLVK